MAAKGSFKRFYKTAAAVPADGGFAIELDGRRVRTPKTNAFVVPSLSLAEAIAAEWLEQGDSIDPQSMPLTGLANAAIDHISADSSRFVDQIVSYAASDLLCYRAETPPRLVQRQGAAWDPLIGWATERLGQPFSVAIGVMPCVQATETLDAVRSMVAARSAFELAGLFSAVTLMGSAILGLAVVEGRIPAEMAWAAARIDETLQAEDWGQDAEAEARAAKMGEELSHAERFLRLLKA
jgi:chaperone required for assembly of F1-ATPase